MKVILYFGSFNPVHNGHLTIAKNAFKLIDADQLVFIPNYVSFNNKVAKSNFVNANDRLNMLKLAISNIDNFKVNDYEINQKKLVYTIDTLNYLIKTTYSNDEIYILIGYDHLIDFNNWKDSQEILKLAKIIAYKRNGFEINKNLYDANKFIFIENEMIDISSSIIRQNYLVSNLDSKVLNYINEYGIYLDLRVGCLISEKRFSHSLRVAKMCYELMKKYDPSNALKGWVSGAYHDICKELSKEKTLELVNEYNLDNNLSWKVMHGPIAKYYLKQHYCFKDEMVLNAIENHTIPNLSLPLTILDKLLYCCDKLEPNRTNEDVENIEWYRQQLNENLDECFNNLLIYQKKLFQ